MKKQYKKYTINTAHGHFGTNNPIFYFFYLIAIFPVTILMGLVMSIGKIFELIFGSDFIDEKKDKKSK